MLYDLAVPVFYLDFSSIKARDQHFNEITAYIFPCMARTSRSRSPPMRNAALPIRTRDPLAQTGTISPVAGKLISTQADRCRYSDCSNESPHDHSTAEGITLPSVEEYGKASEAIRDRWTEEQRRRIAENEALLRELAGIEPKVGRLSTKAHLPRGNDLTVQEQIEIIHGGAGQVPDEALLEEQRRNVIDNTNAAPTVPCTRSSVLRTDDKSQTRTEQTNSLEWDDFPELDAKYPTSNTPGCSKDLTPTPKPPLPPPVGTLYNPAAENAPTPKNPHKPSLHRQINDFLHTTSQLCTGPCPIQTPHNKGAYLHQGQIPRVWNARWGYSDPPREIWDAWVRIEQGRGRSWDEVEVDGFAASHWWCGL